MPNYPTSLDTLTNPTSANTLASPPHATQHTDANDILEALEAKVGIGASTPAIGQVLKGTGAGATAHSPVVVTSDSDPGAIGTGNIWLREYDDTAVTGDLLYQTNIRNAADDGWLRPQLLTIVDGVLRSRITLDGPATGGDIEVRDANGDQLLLMSWGPTGEVDIQNNPADGFSWINKMEMKVGELQLTRTDDNGQHAVFMGGIDSLATLVLSTGDQIVSLGTAGIAITTGAGDTFTYNGSEVAVVP